MREWKMRHGQNCGAGKCGNGDSGTTLQGLKNAWVEFAGRHVFARSQWQALKYLSATVRHHALQFLQAVSHSISSYTDDMCGAADNSSSSDKTTKNLTSKSSRLTRHQRRRSRAPTCECECEVCLVAHYTGTLRPQPFLWSMCWRSAQ